jgi:hypothetical protein
MDPQMPSGPQAGVKSKSGSIGHWPVQFIEQTIPMGIATQYGASGPQSTSPAQGAP